MYFRHALRPVECGHLDAIVMLMHAICGQRESRLCHLQALQHIILTIVAQSSSKKRAVSLW